MGTMSKPDTVEQVGILRYFGDTMCSWCWGFNPVLEQVEQGYPELKRITVMGGLRGGSRLLDSSPGNAGIAYAMFGAALGVDVTIVIPGNASRERLERIEAHGAEVILTDPIEGYDFAVREAQRLAAEHPDRYWYANQ